MKELKTAVLPAGSIQYQDSGSGPVLLFLHGMMVDHRLWRKVVPALETRYRCIVPLLPIGSHTLPMPEDADLSPQGVVRLIVQFMDFLKLDRVTLIANDTGGAFSQFLMVQCPERIEKVVLSNCDAFEVFPPRRFEYLVSCSRWPGFVDLMAMMMRIPGLAALPTTMGDMSQTRLELLTAYLKPMIQSKAVRRDLAKAFSGVRKKDMLEVTQQLSRFQKPVLILWGKKDPLFGTRLGERLHRVLPQSELVWMDHSKVLVPEDEPEMMAKWIQHFLQGPLQPQGQATTHQKAFLQ